MDHAGRFEQMESGEKVELSTGVILHFHFNPKRQPQAKMKRQELNTFLLLVPIFNIVMVCCPVKCTSKPCKKSVL